MDFLSARNTTETAMDLSSINYALFATYLKQSHKSTDERSFFMKSTTVLLLRAFLGGPICNPGCSCPHDTQRPARRANAGPSIVHGKIGESIVFCSIASSSMAVPYGKFSTCTNLELSVADAIGAEHCGYPSLRCAL
jgi:hypothetical protein